jgi:hypothetical protein
MPMMFNMNWCLRRLLGYWLKSKNKVPMMHGLQPQCWLMESHIY